MSNVKSYNAADVDIIFAGISIDGKADGTFVTVERRAEAFTLVVGAGGEGLRSKSNDRSATVTLALMQSSAANDALSALAVLDEESGAGVGPLLIKDRSGSTLCAAPTAWIQKFANAEFAKEGSEREWIIETNDLRMFVGGN